MRVAFITFGRYPTVNARAGGDVRIWQDLASLVALGHEVHLVSCDPENALEPEIAAKVATTTIIAARPLRRASVAWLLGRTFNPETLHLRAPDLRGHRTQVRAALDRIRPDLVWAEEQLTAVLVPDNAPFILGHVDFYFRLMHVRDAFRKLRRPNTMTRGRLEDLEYDLSRRARVTLVCSKTDAALFQTRGIAARYIPVVGPTLPPPDPARLSSGRFFLFGKANTAMRAARQHLRTVVWPLLDADLRRDWHQVGDPPKHARNDPSWTWLTQNLTVHGFVDELSGLFQFGDASVMPYPYDASGHAKYSVSMGYGVVNIAYEQAIRSTPELVADINCLAPTSPQGLVDALRRFRDDASLRRRLAAASRATYERELSFEAQLADYEQLLDSAVGTRRLAGNS